MDGGGEGREEEVEDKRRSGENWDDVRRRWRMRGGGEEEAEKEGRKGARGRVGGG